MKKYRILVLAFAIVAGIAVYLANPAKASAQQIIWQMSCWHGHCQLRPAMVVAPTYGMATSRPYVGQQPQESMSCPLYAYQVPGYGGPPPQRRFCGMAPQKLWFSIQEADPDNPGQMRTVRYLGCLPTSLGALGRCD